MSPVPGSNFVAQMFLEIGSKSENVFPADPCFEWLHTRLYN